MSAHSMLDQLLRQGLNLLQGASPSPARSPLEPARPAHPGNRPQAGMDWSSFGAGAATGAASTGALGLLLGRKQALRHAGKVAKYGGIAAIGLMAYKAYSQWQAQQARQAQQAAPPSTAAPGQASIAPAPAALPAPRTVDQLTGNEAETHSRAIFGAMIAAAKADGHLDPRERGLLDAELTRLAADHALRQWVQAELERPLDPAQVARSAQGDPGLAAEMYLASLLVADDQSFMERAYLDELARQLSLPPELKTRLEAQAA